MQPDSAIRSVAAHASKVVLVVGVVMATADACSAEAQMDQSGYYDVRRSGNTLTAVVDETDCNVAARLLNAGQSTEAYEITRVEGRRVTAASLGRDTLRGVSGAQIRDAVASTGNFPCTYRPAAGGPATPQSRTSAPDSGRTGTDDPEDADTRQDADTRGDADTREDADN
jgi:hypothetical protein